MGSMILILGTTIMLGLVIVEAELGVFPHWECKDDQGCMKNMYCPTSSRNIVKYCQHDPACFPGDATVETSDGSVKFMHELKIGDKVLAGKDLTGPLYSDIYAFGHKDPRALHNYIKLDLVSQASTTKLEISGGHYVPVISGNSIIYKRAFDLDKTDAMIGITTNSTLVFGVKDVSIIEKEGLFNPFTLSGSIVVNNVIASVHSDWFLDNIATIRSVLPYIYQGIMFPARFLYNTLGCQQYALLHDSVLSIFSNYESWNNWAF